MPWELIKENSDPLYGSEPSTSPCITVKPGDKVRIDWAHRARVHFDLESSYPWQCSELHNQIFTVAIPKIEDKTWIEGKTWKFSTEEGLKYFFNECCVIWRMRP